jgi:hypothetical protein
VSTFEPGPPTVRYIDTFSFLDQMLLNYALQYLGWWWNAWNDWAASAGEGNVGTPSYAPGYSSAALRPIVADAVSRAAQRPNESLPSFWRGVGITVGCPQRALNPQGIVVGPFGPGLRRNWGERDGGNIVIPNRYFFSGLTDHLAPVIRGIQECLPPNMCWLRPADSFGV